MRRGALWPAVAWVWAWSIDAGCVAHDASNGDTAPGGVADAAPAPDGAIADGGTAREAGAGPTAPGADGGVETPGAVAHPDGGPAAGQLAVTGTCDLSLPSPGWIRGTDGTLANSGPFHPCAIAGGQAFRSMRFSGDGRWVAALGAGGQLVVLDAASLAPRASFSRDRGAYTAFAISADGRLIAGGAEHDGEVDVWRVADHALLRAVDLGPSWPTVGGAVAFSSDGAVVAASAGADTAVIEVATGATRRITEGGSAEAIFFVDGDRKIVSARSGWTTVGTGSGRVSLIDLAAGVPTDLQVGGPFELIQLAASSDGSAFVTFGGELAIWDAATATKRVLPRPPWQDGRFSLVGLSADGAAIGFTLDRWFQRRRAFDDVPIDEVGLDPGTTVYDWSSRSDALLAGPALQHDGMELAVVDRRAARVARRACSAAAATWPIAFSHDGTRLLFGWPEGPPLVVDVASGEPLPPGFLGSPGNADNAALAPDGSMVAWLNREWGAGGQLLSQELRLTSIPDGDSRTLLAKTDGLFTEPALVFSADSRLLASAGWSDAALDIFDTATGELLGQLAAGQHDTVPLGFTTDGAGIRIAIGGVLRTVAWRDGTILDEWTLGGSTMAASADGSTAATFDYESAQQVFREGVLVVTLPAPDDVCFAGSPWMRVAPDGSLAGYTYNCSRPFLSQHGPTTKIYDAASGVLVQATQLADPVVFSWDATMLASDDTIWCRQ